MPVYKITRPNMEKPRCVVANSPAAALKHVADSELTVSRIEVDDAFGLASLGIKLERAGEEPDPDRLREDAQERANLLAEDGDDADDEATEAELREEAERLGL